MNFFLIYFLSKAKQKDKDKKRQENEKKTVLLITAHPDDESMFFIPTIKNLKDVGYKIHLLCLSPGNHRRRKEELEKAAHFLHIDKLTILDLSSKGIID